MYQLVVEISKKSVSKSSRGFPVTISVFGDKFIINPRTQILEIGSKNNSRTNFSITSNTVGKKELEIYFYYKLNMIQRLVTSLEVIEDKSKSRLVYLDEIKPSMRIKFKEEEMYLSTHMVTSSDAGFESIEEIEKIR